MKKTPFFWEGWSKNVLSKKYLKNKLPGGTSIPDLRVTGVFYG